MTLASVLHGFRTARCSFVQSNVLLRRALVPFSTSLASLKPPGIKYCAPTCIPRQRFSAISKLVTPNNEVDWVIVDVATEDLQPNSIPPMFVENIADDAKSLVRVLLRDAPAELSVLLCSDDHMKYLNSTWRGVDDPTDVLSFQQTDSDEVVLGDIVVSVDTAKAQALERNYELRDETRVLLTHGLLHLLGYDHEGEKDGDWLVVSFFVI